MDFDARVLTIIKKPNGSKFFLRKGGAISSLLTSDCLFDRPAAWAESRQYTEAHGNEDVIVFRTVGENAGFLGKTPEEILSAKTTYFYESTKINIFLKELHVFPESVFFYFFKLLSKVK